jgi:hypothetical protein
MWQADSLVGNDYEISIKRPLRDGDRKTATEKPRFLPHS